LPERSRAGELGPITAGGELHPAPRTKLFYTAGSNIRVIPTGVKTLCGLKPGLGLPIYCCDHLEVVMRTDTLAAVPATAITLAEPTDSVKAAQTDLKEIGQGIKVTL